MTNNFQQQNYAYIVHCICEKQFPWGCCCIWEWKRDTKLYRMLNALYNMLYKTKLKRFDCVVFLYFFFYFVLCGGSSYVETWNLMQWDYYYLFLYVIKCSSIFFCCFCFPTVSESDFLWNIIIIHSRKLLFSAFKWNPNSGWNS